MATQLLAEEEDDFMIVNGDSSDESDRVLAVGDELVEDEDSGEETDDDIDFLPARPPPAEYDGHEFDIDWRSIYAKITLDKVVVPVAIIFLSVLVIFLVEERVHLFREAETLRDEAEMARMKSARLEDEVHELKQAIGQTVTASTPTKNTSEMDFAEYARFWWKEENNRKIVADILAVITCVFIIVGGALTRKYFSKQKKGTSPPIFEIKLTRNKGEDFGIILEDVLLQAAVVKEVKPDSPADSLMGLRKNDEILYINGVKAYNRNKALKLIRRSGQTMTLYVRDSIYKIKV